jgi:hypothetical protein
MNRYYIENQSNLIKIYKGSIDDSLVFNNILFSSYSEAKYYLLHFKDTIFQQLGYSNFLDEDLKEYTSLKNRINDLKQNIITIDTIIKKHENYVKGYFQSEEWLARQKAAQLYENVLNEKRLLIISHKEKLASHIREISNLKITAGSLTVDNILNGRYNQVPAYLKSKHIERFAHDYTNDLIKFSKKENEVLDNYKEVLRSFDSKSRSIYKEKKKIVKLHLKEIELQKELKRLELKIITKIPNQNYYYFVNIDNLPFERLQYNKELECYNLFVVYKNRITEIKSFYEYNNQYYIFSSEGMLPSSKCLFLMNDNIGELIQLERKEIILGDNL